MTLTPDDHTGVIGVTTEWMPPARTLQDKIPDNSGDMRLPDDIGSGGLSKKIKDNFAAIDLLKELEESGRTPDDDEKLTLARYVGWGAFGQVFQEKFQRAGRYDTYEDIPDYYRRQWTDADRKHWGVYKELSQRLSEDELESAAASTLNAHFTAPQVVKAMWEACRHMGFTGGRVLEPAVGTGNFFGFEPDDLAANSRRTAVEKDDLTGRIARYLYPAARVHIQGFEEAPLADNQYDLAISNVPFGNFGVHDPLFMESKRNWLTSSIHNYFFAKALDKVRPGGIVAFVTSHHTMDGATHTRFRQHISEKADFLGAVRLPNDAFSENAGTKVTTDIIFLQKKDPAFEALHPRDAQGRFVEKWDEVGEMQVASKYGHETVKVNQYFIDHPEMMLGEMGVGSGYGQMAESETGMKSDGRDLNESLATALQSLPADILHPAVNEQELLERETAKEAAAHHKEGAYIFEDGKIYRNLDGVLEEKKLGGKLASRVGGLCRLRDLYFEYLDLQTDETASDAAIDAARVRLKSAYEAFVAKHGPIHDRSNILAFGKDPDIGAVLALEVWDNKAKAVEKLADTLEKRTIFPMHEVTSAASPEDAMSVVLNERNQLDWKRMSALLGGMAPEAIRDQLSNEGLIYRDPAQEADPATHGWVTADDYLSGNVRIKLKAAQAIAELDPGYQRNVEALTVAQPADLPVGDIDARLAASWIPAEYINDFVEHCTGFRNNREALVTYSNAIGWIVGDVPVWERNKTISTSKWGTSDRDFYQLLQSTLLGKQPRVEEKDLSGKTVPNREATEGARGKQQDIKDEWDRWWRGDPDRADAIARLYNDKFNNERLRTFDGSHLSLPGLADHIKSDLRQHIKDVVWRILQTGNTLIAHCVGAGKTRSMAIAAMEMRRLGLAKKPMIMVPNQMLSQWDHDFREFYPKAKVLTVWARNWTPEKRQELSNMIATGDWDCVLITHNAFTQIPVKPDLYEDFANREIDDLRTALYEVEQAQGEKSKSAKEIRKMIERMEKKLKDKTAKLKQVQDRSITWEQMGVDALFNDEADMHKNLFFATRRTGRDKPIGLGSAESGRAFDFFIKSQHLLQKNGQRGLVLATGTPISNSLSEMYTMQRYLMLPELQRLNISRADDWLNTYSETTTSTQQTPSGQWKERTILDTFVNMPELVKLFRKTADVKTEADLDLPIPEIEGGAPQVISAPSSPYLRSYMDEIKERCDAISAGLVLPEVDNMLKVSGDARKASLDMRLIDPSLPDWPDSKINKCVDRVFRNWKTTDDRQATQLIFLDLSTPKTKSDADDDAAGPTVASASAVDADGDESDEILTSEEQEWRDTVYGDIRKKLIARGMSPEHIAFAHDFKTDEEKADRNDRMNKGLIRVLIGSTEKMGAGLNVQDRLFALNHIDVPWRPRDLTQRNGRGVRQGNMHYDLGIPIQVNVFGTEDSFDSYMWQTISYKQKVIDQALSGDLSVRRMKDMSSISLTANEAIGVLSGDPVVTLKVNNDSLINRLQSQKRNHDSEQQSVQRQLLSMPQQLSIRETRLQQLREVSRIWSETKPKDFEMMIGGNKVTKRENAGDLLNNALNTWAGKHAKEAMSTDEVRPQKIAEYGGFDIFATYNPRIADAASKYRLEVQPKPEHGAPQDHNVFYAGTSAGTAAHDDNFIRPGDSGAGTISSLDYFLHQSAPAADKVEGTVKALRDEIETLKSEYGKPWARQGELDEALRLADEYEKQLKGPVGDEATPSTKISQIDDADNDSDEPDDSGIIKALEYYAPWLETAMAERAVSLVLTASVSAGVQ